MLFGQIEVPELREVIGEEAASRLENDPSGVNLKLAFSNLMKSEKAVVAAQLEKLLGRLSKFPSI